MLVAPDGSVLLAATGLAWRRPPGEVDGPRTADDVAATGDLLRDLLGRGSAPSPLVLAALRASDGDPALRPAPSELRGLLERCGRADPLLDLLLGTTVPDLAPPPAGPPVGSPIRRPAGSAADPSAEAAADRAGADGGAGARPALRALRSRGSAAPPRPAARDRGAARHPRRPSGRPVVLLVPALALLGLAVLRVGAGAVAEGATTGSSPAAVAPGATTSVGARTGSDPVGAGADLRLDRDAGSAAPSAPDWPAVLAAVDAGRQRALASGSVAALRDWVDPAGPAWAGDSALAARVSALHARIEGGALVRLDVRLQSVDAARSVLLVSDRRDAYTVVTATGTTDVPARAPRWWRVTLVRAAPASATAAEGWRVHDVAAVDAPAG